MSNITIWLCGDWT